MYKERVGSDEDIHTTIVTWNSMVEGKLTRSSDDYTCGTKGVIHHIWVRSRGMGVVL